MDKKKDDIPKNTVHLRIFRSSASTVSLLITDYGEETAPIVDIVLVSRVTGSALSDLREHTLNFLFQWAEFPVFRHSIKVVQVFIHSFFSRQCFRVPFHFFCKNMSAPFSTRADSLRSVSVIILK